MMHLILKAKAALKALYPQSGIELGWGDGSVGRNTACESIRTRVQIPSIQVRVRHVSQHWESDKQTLEGYWQASWLKEMMNCRISERPCLSEIR